MNQSTQFHSRSSVTLDSRNKCSTSDRMQNIFHLHVNRNIDISFSIVSLRNAHTNPRSLKRRCTLCATQSLCPLTLRIRISVAVM